ncbi:protein FAR-RED ELONGATED HYPOCOTYL 3-like [Silene latifolia]|uniref:protein FAR-RED ELONGATED HYPOCOTYL 3-like n=1 Tax=Silene latifolia TaxID=37657 RepID=UPI003D779300
MDDEASTATVTNLSSAMGDGVSKGIRTSMEIVVFNPVSMSLERQPDEKSTCQAETIDLSSPMVGDTSKGVDNSMEIALLESISTDPEKQHEVIAPHKGANISFSYVEAEQSELIGRTFDSGDDAYEAYRRYSFVKCFGVRHSTIRRSSKGDVIGKEFCCCKQGTKADKGVVGKIFTKLDRRTNCKAMVKVDPSTVKYLLDLQKSGIRLADGIRSLSNHAEGPAIMGFEYGDAAVAVKKAKNKKFDSTDYHTLIEILKQRAASEEDFYYDFELDEDNSLVSVYIRDTIMRKDYEAFYEVLENDGTYCTNKYDMICAPFVGVNNHTRICMFGIGFMLNESIESFEWLYTTFLTSMGGIQPKTIMTEQSAAMKRAIAKCFPQSKHRLCVWHLFKNAATHLGKLKEKAGFNKLFGRILKRCHTEEKLNYCWNRMVTEYNCGDHQWLSKLYELKEKWCCAYGKDYFSACVISSQRSESANNSISKHLSKTSTLCDCYEIFGSVVSDWRNHERKDNSLCWEGKEFTKGLSYKHKLQSSFETTLSYFVYTERNDEFGHVVTFESSSNYACCTCKRFEESGFLCRHILRIYHCNCVDEIPIVYVLKRWTNDAKPKDHVIEVSKGKVVGPVWRLDMQRQFHKLIIACCENDITRGIVNDCFEKAKSDIEAVVGGIQCSDVEGGDVVVPSTNNHANSHVGLRDILMSS